MKRLTKPDRDKLTAAESVLRGLGAPVRVALDRTGVCVVSLGDTLATEAATLADAVDRALT